MKGSLFKIFLTGVIFLIAMCEKNFSQIKASFTYSVNGYVVSFNNTSSGGNFYYSWWFHDGNYSNAENPVHAFTNAGTYTVYLVAVDITDSTQYDVTSDNITISVNSPGCKANFNFDNQSDTITFFNISTGVDSTSSFNWDFGDSTTSNLSDPSHIFLLPGNYNVCLKTYSNSCSDSACQNVKVKSKYNTAARFIYEILKPDTAVFICKNINPNAAYFYTFGDNATSTEKNPFHVYSANGKYPVSLTLTDVQTGDFEIYNDTVYIKDLPECHADFTYTINDRKVVFTNLSSGKIINYNWDFGDGSAPYLSLDTIHEYKSYGTFKVKLYVAPSSNITDSAIYTINVLQPINTHFVSGSIYAGTNVADYAKVLIYSFDSITNNCQFVDSTIVLPGHKGKYIFSDLNHGYYMLVAMPLKISKYYSTFSEMYFGHATTWKNSQQLDLNSFGNMNFIDIYLNEFIPRKSNSKITGKINFDSTKSLVVNNTYMILYGSDKSLKYAVNVMPDGSFVFDDILCGIYNITPEAIGYESYPLQIKLNKNYSYSNADFVIDKMKIFPADNNSVSSVDPDKYGISLYPVPSGNFLYIENLEHRKLIKCIIYNSEGKNVFQTSQNGDEKIFFDLTYYNSGVYILSVIDSEGISISKRFIKE